MSRTGFLSTKAEIHSFVLGIYDGLKSWRIRPKTMRDNDDVTKEPHYYAGGYIVSTGLQVLICMIVGHQTGVLPV